MLKSGGGAAAAFVAGSALPAVVSGRARRGRAASFRPPSAEPPAAPERAPAPRAPAPQASTIVDDRALHVARRLTYGITPGTLAAVKELGIAGWIDRQLSPASIPDHVCDRYLERFPLLGLGPAEVASKVPVGSFEQMSEMQSAAVVRAAWSERQIFELVCELWWNHFNVGIPNSDVWNLCGLHERILKRGALGKFSDLLASVVRSPAMLVALNQTESVHDDPNENYAREMMELHTVGVGNYSEEDVSQASLLLTGLGLTPDGCSFAFSASNHYVGPVKVMGFRDANSSASGGLAVIERYLSYLAHHPGTARHLATKLATRFVSDSPSPSLVSALAATYLENDTAIVPVLKHLFSTSEFFESAGAKMRRPVEQVAASLRVLDYRLATDGTCDISDLAFALEIMGQAPMGWPQPNGYPDTAGDWVSASFFQSAWGVHIRLAGGWWTEVLAFPGVLELLQNPPVSRASGTVLDALSRRLLFQTVAPSHRAALLAFMQRSEHEPIGADGLANLDMVAKAVLDSPYFALR